MTEAPSQVFAGGGDMGAMMRAFDWSLSPLGPVEAWPQNLKTCVRIILTSRQPMFVWWGDALINLYNDAYRSILGGKHPWALGKPAPEVWREIWDQVGPRAAATMGGNEGTYDEALLLIMERNGYPEETYYTFSYSPIPNDKGGTGGILCANTDDTQRIVSGRRLALLGELAARTTGARTWQDACVQAAAALETGAKSIPFALLYMADPGLGTAELAGTVRIAPGGPAAPERVDLAAGCVWPLAEALRGQRLVRIPDLGERFGPLPTGAWDRPPKEAVAVPIAASGSTGRPGVLVAGINPYRPLDEDYRSFLELATSQIASSLATAHAYEEERRRAEALAELDRAKTAFFSNVSHEFRTPLTLMLGPLEDCLRETDGRADPAQRERLEMIRRNGARLLKLVNNLLDFSRLEAGRAVAHYRPVDLRRATEDLASVFRSAVAQAGLGFEVDCADLGEPAYVDPDMWEKIVLNLLSNALKFTFAGRISVSLRREGGQAVLRVSDTGVGIPAGELPRIFTRFHRVQGAQSRTHEGSGIGLALVQELARLHGGSARVESEAGRGTTFSVAVPLGAAHLPADRLAEPAARASGAAGDYVEEAARWLPASRAEGAAGPGRAPAGEAMDAPDAPPAPAAGKDAPSGARILLADDNRDMRDYVARILSARWRVDAVANGREALERARRDPPDLILSDVMMPELDGFQLLRALRGDPATAGIPMILLSARAGEESTEEGLRAGADDYLVKPFASRELLARVEARLEIDRLRRRQERDLRGAEREAHKFQSLVEQSSDFIGIGDMRGNPAYINPAGLRLVGLEADRDLGAIKPEDFYFPEDLPELAPIGQALDRDGHWEGEVRLRHFRTGKGVPVWMNVFLLRDRDTGAPFSIATVSRDLSQLKETEEHLRQAQKMEAVGKLAGGIAHDFNNLLTAINGFAGLALASGQATGELREHLDEIRKSGERAAQLTHQLLAYSRKQILAPRVINLNDILRDMDSLLRRLIGEDVELALRLEEDLGWTKADPGQIQQVIMNLALNARDAMPNGGRLTLETASVIVDERFLATHLENKPGPYVMLSASDTGVGMTPEVLARAFEPFFTTKPVGKGTGMGLSSVYGIVKQSGGAIAVESRPGAGATFRIYLPLIQPPRRESRSEAGAGSAPEASAGTLLLAEDEDSVRRFVRRVLEKQGYRVLEARDGVEALEVAENSREDIRVLLTDMVMPRMGGRALADRFRTLRPDARILMMSGYTDREYAEPGDAARAYLQKPFRPESLLEAVRALVHAAPKPDRAGPADAGSGGIRE